MWSSLVEIPINQKVWIDVLSEKEANVDGLIPLGFILGFDCFQEKSIWYFPLLIIPVCCNVSGLKTYKKIFHK